MQSLLRRLCLVDKSLTFRFTPMLRAGELKR
jgi:hypothetical protein